MSRKEHLITLRNFHIKNYHNSRREDMKRGNRTEEVKGQDGNRETGQNVSMPFREKESFSLSFDDPNSISKTISSQRF